VLSIYGYELEISMDQIKDEVVKYLKEESKWSTDVEVEVVVRFVDTLWHTNVGFQGTKDITDSMVPVLLPIAQLVQATE
jgi:gamma-glutamylcysteine synthetase